MTNNERILRCQILKKLSVCMKKTAVFITLTIVLLVLSACGAANPYTPSDDIISYAPVDSSKTVITIGKYAVAETDELESLLEARFPGVDFVFTEPDAGDNDIAYMKLMSDGGKLEDIQFCAHAAAHIPQFPAQQAHAVLVLERTGHING